MNSNATPANVSRNPTTTGGEVPFGWPAFLLGLVFPGLGHASIGERGRGWRIAAGFLVLWTFGLLVGGPSSVQLKNPAFSMPSSNRSTSNVTTSDLPDGGTGTTLRLWFIPQAGAGPIAFVTAFASQAMTRAGDDRLEVTMPDRTTATIDRHTAIGHALDFGTLFCALAGLMNVAVALDAGRRTVDRRGGER